MQPPQGEPSLSCQYCLLIIHYPSKLALLVGFLQLLRMPTLNRFPLQPFHNALAFLSMILLALRWLEAQHKTIIGVIEG